MALWTANADVTPITINLLEISGVTPPVTGATPVDTVTENSQYTGTVYWESQDGELLGNFQHQTIYKATITLNPKDGYTLIGVEANTFSVAGATNVLNFDDEGVISAYFIPSLEDATESFDFSFTGDGSVAIKDIFGESPLLENGDQAGPLTVDRIAVDSVNKIVVLASFRVDGENFEKHILFRLNENGSYDDSFNPSGPTLRRSIDDTRKPYVLVATTCPSYRERLDLEIDSEDKILVMLSGTTDGDACSGTYINFVARYSNDGNPDTDFGESGDGIIGSSIPQPGPAEFLFADIALDGQGHILVADLSNDELLEVGVARFMSNGLLDPEFGNVLQGAPPTRMGFSILELSLPEGTTSVPYRNVIVMADNTGGYMIGFTGSINNESGTSGFTHLQRLDENGDLDLSFTAPEGFGFNDTNYVVPYFLLTDLVPDGVSGFLMAGTLTPPGDDFQILSVTLRVMFDGNYDTNFVRPIGDTLLNPIVSQYCFNSSILKNQLSYETNDGVIAGNYCGMGNADAGRLKVFSSSGNFEGDFSVEPTFELGFAGQFVNQLILTRERSIVSLSGSRPTAGALGLIDSIGGGFGEVDWTNPIITRYGYLESSPTNPPLSISGPGQINGTVSTEIETATLTINGGTGSETVTVTSGTLPAGLTLVQSGSRVDIFGTPTSVVDQLVGITVANEGESNNIIIRFVISPTNVHVYIPPQPIPYLKTLSIPKIKMIADKLVCAAGTYNFGYTLNGVIQGSATTIFTPVSYTYNLIFNGITQTSLAITSNINTASWNLVAVPRDTLASCSVTISVNSLTNIDKSTDNFSEVVPALLTQRDTIESATTEYVAAIDINSKAYQKALLDNRAKWRSDTEKIRADYNTERDRIKALPSTKATRAAASTALKVYIAAQKKSASDYKASQPAAVAARDAANKAALEAKNTAIAKANAIYATFIESIGYGVLIP